jgi:hypothetical protein
VVDNRVADALSKRCEELQSYHAISSCQPQWLQELVDSYESDPTTREIITKLTIDPSSVPHFTWQQGVLRYKNRVWVGSAPLLQYKLIIAFHDSALGWFQWVVILPARQPLPIGAQSVSPPGADVVVRAACTARGRSGQAVPATLEPARSVPTAVPPAIGASGR